MTAFGAQGANLQDTAEALTSGSEVVVGRRSPKLKSHRNHVVLRFGLRPDARECQPRL
jgi:hypothetical protein